MTEDDTFNILKRKPIHEVYPQILKDGRRTASPYELETLCKKHGYTWPEVAVYESSLFYQAVIAISTDMSKMLNGK